MICNYLIDKYISIVIYVTGSGKTGDCSIRVTVLLEWLTAHLEYLDLAFTEYVTRNI